MPFSIITKTNEKTFENKNTVHIGTQTGVDFSVDFGFEFLLTVQYDPQTNKCILYNRSNTQKFLFKGQPLPQKLEIDRVCKIMIDGSDDFITIKYSQPVAPTAPAQPQLQQVPPRVMKQEAPVQNNSTNIAQKNTELEGARIKIVKEIGYKINEYRHKLSINSKSGIVLHIILFLASMICAFGVSNYLSGLELSEIENVIQIPTNIKLLLVYSLIIYGMGILLKQGIFLYFQNNTLRDENTKVSRAVEKFMIVWSSLFYFAIYIINVLYYISAKMPVFSICMSLFFTGTAAALAIGCGFFKHLNVMTRHELDKYEYREDFERVIKEYQRWIEKSVNGLPDTKINAIKDKLFNLQIKSYGETILGIITAPFLAFGVSNTLAMCFPEAAGWVRISGLRFSPIFLVLATFLIIFAFFSFVNGFTSKKKVRASDVIRYDGYSNYLDHGVNIYGLEGVKKLDADMRHSFIIAVCIIFIEFSMNVSYFTQEIGGNLNGMLLSATAALVPTALLIAETFMLSQTKFETYALEELIAKLDR